MQLLFVGQQDVYIKFNPQITYFKKVFKTHSNFAMESIRVDLNRSELNIYEPTQFKVKIPRHADLVCQVYFVVTLPDIISDNIMSFRWVKDIGEALIRNCYITIGGNKIDQQTGEFLHINNQLSLSFDKRDIYDKMTGNTLQMNNPEEFSLQYNALSRIPLRYRIGDTYPTVRDPVYNSLNPDMFETSIPRRTIYIPLQFWFNRDIGNALPLVSLQYSEVEITIETNPMTSLYKLFYNVNGVQDFYAPSTDIIAHRLANFVTNERQRFLISDTVMNVDAHLEANYIYLDTLERNYFAYKPLEYLIQQVTRVEALSVGKAYTVDFKLQNPVKELMWFLRRSDAKVTNNWFDFMEINGAQIMKTAKLLFNGIDRFNDKPAEYFSYLQPYQHHTTNHKEGLFCYSFAIEPEAFQPSGSFNASRVNNIQFYITAKSPDDQTYNYDLVVYALSYNFLVIQSGLGSVKFSL